MVATLGLALPLSQAHGAIVTAVGSIQDNAGGQVVGWQDTNIAKTMDIDGDNAYGSIYADNPGTNAHGVTSAGSEAVGLYLPDYPFQGVVANTFVQIDSPRDPVGPNKATEAAGIVYTNGQPLVFHFTLTGPAEYYADKTVRMGFMYDIAEPGRNGAVLSLQQSDLEGTAAFQFPTFSNDDFQGNPVVIAPDMYFFDITGATSGQQFTFSVYDSSDGINYFSGYSMDIVAAPEPGSMALLGVGAAGFAMLRRRKARI